MRQEFWAKLAKEEREFKWFFDKYIKGKHKTDRAYNTLYQQAKGEILTKLHSELEVAMKEYLEDE